MINLGLDLDGVIYDWHTAVFHELEIYEGLDQDFDTFWRSGYKSYRNKLYWDSLVQLKHLYSNQIPKRELVEMLERLANKYTFHYITNRPREVFDATSNWLKRYKLPYNYNLYHTNNKIIVCNSLGIETIVEDRTNNVLSLYDAGINVIVIRQPYNEEDIHLFEERNLNYLDSILELERVL